MRPLVSGESGESLAGGEGGEEGEGEGGERILSSDSMDLDRRFGELKREKRRRREKDDEREGN